MAETAINMILDGIGIGILSEYMMEAFIHPLSKMNFPDKDSDNNYMFFKFYWRYSW